MEKITLTEEQDMILDYWFQWSYKSGRGSHTGGLSALEHIERYLKSKGILNSLGNFNHKLFVRYE